MQCVECGEETQTRLRGWSEQMIAAALDATADAADVNRANEQANSKTSKQPLEVLVVGSRLHL